MSRFEWGLVTDIHRPTSRPDRHPRQESPYDRLEVDDDVLTFSPRRSPRTSRARRGPVRILAYASLYGPASPSADLAEEVLMTSYQTRHT